MPYDPNLHHRRSIRLREYDYARAGAYFVTICVRDHACVLGRVGAGVMELSALGEIAAASWLWLEEHHPYVSLDAWVIMPNHLHGILVLDGAPQTAALSDQDKPYATDVAAKHKPLGRLIGAFKTTSTAAINRLRNTPGTPFWQRNYYEHVVRDDADLARIRAYVATNPLRWVEDRYYRAPC
ncbi:MAG: transposase [Anaerolineae bacterium]|nr:transposase [Anaerolineae bacterium]